MPSFQKRKMLKGAGENVSSVMKCGRMNAPSEIVLKILGLWGENNDSCDAA